MCWFHRVIVCCAGALSSAVIAAETEFPYVATVAQDGAEVRAGRGAEFYATARLPVGTAVTVIRHDPGGWCVIEPPPGSFSYIRPSFVKELGGGRGIVTVPGDPSGAPSRAVVRIGSSLSNDAFASGRLVPNGQKVTILGRAVVNTGGGRTQEMLRIAPPIREYRWIRGDAITSPGDDALVAASETTQPIGLTPGNGPAITTTGPRLGTKDTASVPFGAEMPQAAALDAQVEKTVVSGAARRTTASASQVRAEQKTLAAIDQRFRDMVASDPGTWNLDTLEKDYRALFDSTQSESVKSLVGKRLAAVQRRREVYRQYLDFVDLTTKTSEREAELLAEQRANATRSADLSVPLSLGPGQAVTPQPNAPATGTAPPAATTFDGAGVIVAQQTPLGLTRYLLVSPTGRTLAIVRPAAGLDLRPHLNQPRGLIGKRQYDPTAGIDVIDVQRLQPVQLSAAPN